MYVLLYVETDAWSAVPTIRNNLLLIGAEEDLIVPVQGLEEIAARTRPTGWLYSRK